MACSHYENDECRNGFPVTTGCRAEKDSVLEKLTIGHVVCMNEGLCARLYPETGCPKKALI